MKFWLRRASDDFGDKRVVELESIADLIAIITQEGHDVIVGPLDVVDRREAPGGIEYEVMVYDDYVE